ncbi:MAG TPA: two-component regulator propeller domain-containing protein, partial [Flavobacterium sp.]|nr:two-component regulator propeller domain-containing protein [Flavobacterium sp.]
NVFISDASGGVFRIQNDVPAAFSTLPSVVTDLRAANGYMVATSKERVNVFQDLAQVFQVNFINYDEPGNITFNCATVINSRLYVGTNEKGVFTSPLTTASFENITPDGPERSNIFRIKKSPNFLWVVYGDYSPAYNPDPAEFYGVGKYGANGWLRIFFDYLFYLPNISDIAVHPNNENVAYVSSYYRGLIKIEDNTGVVKYDENIEDEDGPESDTPGQSRVFINSLAFDNEGDLWMTNAFVENAIKVLRPDSDDWDAYSVEDIVATTPDNEPYGRMAIDKNNTKWIPSRFTGVIGFNEDIDKFIVITTGDNGNLPAADARCVAVDKNGRLWIGTTMGLRVLSNIDRFMTEDELTTNPIIIMEDGLAQELMFEQGIVDIEVDGSNNKWIGTATAGAFLVSPDGQETLFHFTKENSPLPSNTINDIEIDDQTGEVFFATNKGMVSYAGTSTEAEDDLSNVYVFPNPVRPEFQGDVNISGLMDNVNLKITDIEGNLVYETTSEGGTVLWDTRAFGKYKVASGVYMIFIASEDGSKTKVKKVMIIR